MPKYVKCKVSDVINVTVRTAMSDTSPAAGFISNAQSAYGYIFCLTDEGDGTRNPGTNDYYKLENPSRYGLNVANGYVKITQNAVSYAVVIEGDSVDAIIEAYRVSDVDTETVDNNITNSPFVGPTQTSSSDHPYSTEGITAALEAVRNSASNQRAVDKDPLTETFNSNNYNAAEYDSNDLTKLRLINRLFNIPYDTVENNAYQNNILRAFDRYKIGNPYNALSKAFPRVFVTRPSLNLYQSDGKTLLSEVSQDPLFYQINETDPIILQSLTDEFASSDVLSSISGHHFNPFLSNMAMSFDTQDEAIENVEVGETFTGWSVKYGRHNIKSRGAGSFSISYNDNQQLQVYKIHKAWVEYISKVYRGELHASKNSIHKRILDYAVSIYYFLCAEDGETILYWTKYVGVFPVKIPASSFSWSKGSIISTPEHSIEYEYAWKEDLNPFILRDFNINAGLDGSVIGLTPSATATGYSSAALGMGYSFAGRPYIETTFPNNELTLKLKYAKLG